MASNQEMDIEQEIKQLREDVQYLKRAVQKIVESLNIMFNQTDPDLLLDIDI